MTAREQSLRLGMVINQPGNMDVRAQAISVRLSPHVETDILVAPTARTVLSRCSSWDVVYVIDPGRRGMPAAVISRGFGKPTLVEIGDPQRELYQAQGRSGPAVLAGATCDALVTRGASGVIFRGAGLAKTLRPTVPWAFIPDGVDPDLFRVYPDDRTREKLGLPGDALVAGVVGNIHWSAPRQSAYGLDLVAALGRLQEAPVWALIVGGGDGVERLRERAKELGVADRVVLTGRRPHSEIPRLLNAMDVCISTQTDDAIGRGRTTAKLPEYLACDRFVLATGVGTAAEILPREMLMSHGASGDPAHQTRLAVRLGQLSERRAELRRGAGTRQLALEHFDYARVAERLLSFLRKVMGT